MPELPEVETMVRGLRPALEGRRLRRVEQPAGETSAAPEGMLHLEAVVLAPRFLEDHVADGRSEHRVAIPEARLPPRLGAGAQRGEKGRVAVVPAQLGR